MPAHWKPDNLILEVMTTSDHSVFFWGGGFLSLCSQTSTIVALERSDQVHVAGEVDTNMAVLMW